MQIIKKDNKIFSIIYRNNDWKEGLNFITPNELSIQVGSWWYQKGKILDSHLHNEFPRIANRTMEMTYVKSGSMKVTLFDEEQNFFDEFVLYEGDLAVFAYGGHGYEILENNTKIIESKNGPFTDVDKDKKKF